MVDCFHFNVVSYTTFLKHNVIYHEAVISLDILIYPRGRMISDPPRVTDTIGCRLEATDVTARRALGAGSWKLVLPALL